MLTPQDSPSNQDPIASTTPTEADLVPSRDSTTTFSTYEDPSVSKKVASHSHFQQSSTVDTRQCNSLSDTAPDTPPNHQISCEAPRSNTPNQSVKLTTNTISQKRPLLSARLKGSIHKPFRSPLRIVQSSDLKPATMIKERNSISHNTDTVTNTTAPISSSSSSPRPPRTHLGPRKPSASNIPGVGKRTPFRSPIPRSQQTTASNDTAYGRLLQIQMLQARITELQSSIRKGQQILKQQQKSETPIEELTAKWKKASQDGAQVLLEKYIEQQSVFDGWDDDSHNGSNDRRISFERGYRSQQLPWNYSTGTPMTGMSSLHELGPEGLQAMEEYLEYQDVQQDLPTVDEAVRSRDRPEVASMAHLSTGMTKMQKMLLGLGIDLDVIGYDPDQDAFVS